MEHCGGDESDFLECVKNVNLFHIVYIVYCI